MITILGSTKHEIWTYPNIKPVQQKIRPVNPRKEVAIKAEVEKLLKAGFIYPICLREWVSNPIDPRFVIIFDN